MADVDSNLVKAIAEQVLAALRTVGTAPAPADIHAPLGTCTGDYSKFPELRPASAPPVLSTKHSALSTTPDLLCGVITADRIKRLKGAVHLAPNAILTPLAQDLIKDRHLTVVHPGQAASAALSPTGQFYSWIDGQCSNVAQIHEQFRPHLLPSREPSTPDALPRVLKELSSLLRTKRISGGLLFVSSAARAACYANRCPSLRAFVATNDRAVSDALEHLAANVLILEYPHHGLASMQSLIAPFLTTAPQLHPATQRALDELRTCG